MQVVTAAILVKDGKICIARRKPDERRGGKWEFPGGKLRAGETPEQCLAREIKEELGIDVSVGDRIGESIHAYEDGVIRLLAYRVFWQGGRIRLHAHTELRWAAVNELPVYDFAAADRPFVEKLMREPI